MNKFFMGKPIKIRQRKVSTQLDDTLYFGARIQMDDLQVQSITPIINKLTINLMASGSATSEEQHPMHWES